MMSRWVSQSRWRTLGVALVAALVGCDGDDGGPTVGSPAQLAFTVQPGDATAGAAIVPAGAALIQGGRGHVISAAVEIQDASGNRVATATNAVTLTIGTGPAGGTLSGTTTVNAVDGVASFSGLTIERAGPGYTLEASATGLTGATSEGFSISPAAAAQLAFTVEPSETDANQAIAPAVEVAIQDEFGNTVTTATDTVILGLGANPSGGTLTGTTGVIATGGQAAFADLAIDRTGGGYTLVAASGNRPLAGATSGPFDVVFTFVAVSGGRHTCGLQITAAAYCWGENTRGQLGDGTLTDRQTPVLVSGGLSFVTVSAGFTRHTCGVSTGGAAYCWGNGFAGQLGDGTATNSSTPVLVSGGLSFVTVSAGGNHTCGVSTGGAAYCWGDNSNGELGDGTETEEQLTPVLVSGGHSFATMSASQTHTCGVITGGAAYCWGSNVSGQLGDGTATPMSNTPVLVSGGLSFVTVSAGGRHSCAVSVDGAAYCWGRNIDGELGDGTTTNRLSPVPVSGGLSFDAVSTRRFHTCGVTPGGDAYCWGANFNGQLGDGTTTDRSSPVPVSGGLSFASVSAGGLHTCGVTTDGDAYCWGTNFDGQLGDGTVNNSSVPVRVVE